MKFFGIEIIKGSKQMESGPSALFYTDIKWGAIVAVPLKELEKVIKEMGYRK
jgi:hypothetical protein